MRNLKAPFPYFGGKTKVAADVWKALGQPKHYIEPFFGSGAVLLNRPGWNPGMTETINDADGYVANVWRALQNAPDEVAKIADWPVNHADLIARKARLVIEKNYLLENLCYDEKWYDIEIAGYWIWAASCWIGSGLTRPGQIPRIDNGGKGIHAKGQIPHLTDSGMGIHAKGNRPHVGHGETHVTDMYNTNIYKWFRRLSERLRYVRVVCGDWSRVCGGNWQNNMGVCGIFFDPPYGDKDRENVYDTDSYSVAEKVSEWAVERGDNPDYRIVIAGYDTEHSILDDANWHRVSWQAQGGYANIQRNENSKAKGKENRSRETLWFSPHCLGFKKTGELNFD